MNFVDGSTARAQLDQREMIAEYARKPAGFLCNTEIAKSCVRTACFLIQDPKMEAPVGPRKRQKGASGHLRPELRENGRRFIQRLNRESTES